MVLPPKMLLFSNPTGALSWFLLWCLLIVSLILWSLSLSLTHRSNRTQWLCSSHCVLTTAEFSLWLPGSLPSPSTHTNFIQMTPGQQDAKLTQGKIWDGSNSTNQISPLMPWSFQQLGWQLYCWWNRGQPWSGTNLPEYTVPERSHGKHSLPTLDHGTEAEGTEVRVMGYCKYASHETTHPALPWGTSIKIHIGGSGGSDALDLT